METLSLIGIFLFSFNLAIGAVISPGPVSAAIVSQSPRHGWLAGPLVASGHSVLELLILALVAAGLSSGLASGWIQTAIALLGGALLVWMGVSMGWSAWQGRWPAHADLGVGSLPAQRSALPPHAPARAALSGPAAICLPRRTVAACFVCFT